MIPEPPDPRTTERPLLIAVMGPTASGKSAVAEELADRLGLQLVSADAFMVYRGLDIGTNKPRDKAKYELLDIVDPRDEFGVGEFVRRAAQVLERVWSGPPSQLATSGEGAGGEGPHSESPFHPSPVPPLRSERMERGPGGEDDGVPPPPSGGEGAGGEGPHSESPFHPSPVTRHPPPVTPKGAIVVGGTGFYVRALFEQYKDLKPAPDPALRERLEDRERTAGLPALVADLQEIAPEVAATTDLKNPVRVRRALERALDPRPPIQFSLPPFQRLKFVLDPPQDDLDQAINRRVEAMFAAGWLAEVEQLLAQGVPKNAPAFRAIGYECAIELLEGRLAEEEAKLRIATETRQYARRQRTWLRTEPHAHPVPNTNGTRQALDEIMCCLNRLGH